MNDPLGSPRKPLLPLLLAATAALLLGCSRGSSAAAEILGGVPEDCLLVVGTVEPEALLAQVIEGLERARKSDERMDRSMVEAREELGFDLFDLDAFRDVGIDLQRPLTISLGDVPDLDRMGWMCLSFGVHDPDGTWDQLTRWSERFEFELTEPSAPGAPTGMVSRDSCWGAYGLAQERGHFGALFNPRRERDVLPELERYVAGLDKTSRWESGVDAKVLELLGEPLTLLAVADMAALLGAVEAPSLRSNSRMADLPVLRDLRRVAATLNGRTLRGVLELEPRSPLLELARTSAEDPRKFLARFPEPTVAVTTTSADPIEGLVGVLRDFELLEPGIVGAFERGVMDQTGLRARDVGALMAGSAGLALYPIDRMRVHFAAFTAVTDEARVMAALDAWMANPANHGAGPRFERRETDDRGVLWTSPDEELAVALVDGHLVFGSAVPAIEALLSGRDAKWDPALETSAFLAVEVHMNGLLTTAPRNAREALEASGLNDAEFVLEANVKDEHFLSVEVTRQDPGTLADLVHYMVLVN